MGNIQLGNVSINEIYAGNNPVNAVYIGSTLIWSNPASVESNNASLLNNDDTVTEDS